jgi:hypothetical protein
VMNERRRAYSINPGPEHPIVVRDLRKVFSGRGGAKELIAVQNMSLAVAEGECFGYAVPFRHTLVVQISDDLDAHTAACKPSCFCTVQPGST